MIIDIILDRKDGEQDGEQYNEYKTLKNIYDSALLFDFDYLSRALDYGNNAEITMALCEYIDRNEYNPNIKDYIKSRVWLTD